MSFAATIAKRLAQQHISLESIVQRRRDERPHGGEEPGRSGGEPVPVIIPVEQLVIQLAWNFWLTLSKP